MPLCACTVFGAETKEPSRDEIGAMNLHELIRKLEEIDRARGDAFVNNFESTLGEIAQQGDPKSIRMLLNFFEDESPFDEVMFSIIHTIEIFDDATFVREILEAAPSFCQQSPRWASILLMRILNSESTRPELVRQLRDASSETKGVVRSLLEKINQRGPQFLAKTTAALLATAQM